MQRYDSRVKRPTVNCRYDFSSPTVGESDTQSAGYTGARASRDRCDGTAAHARSDDERMTDRPLGTPEPDATDPDVDALEAAEADAIEAAAPDDDEVELGRASCRERVLDHV